MQTIKQLLKIGVGAIIIGLTVTYVLAWTGPPGNPPTPNADAPITVSGTGQTKAGGLWLNTNNAPFGLIVDKGYVGIGTTNPNDTLDVNGTIRGQHAFVDSYSFVSWPSNNDLSAATYVDVPNSSKSVTVPSGTALLFWSLSASGTGGVGDYLVRICTDSDPDPDPNNNDPDCSRPVNPYLGASNEVFSDSLNKNITAGTKTIKLQVRKLSGTNFRVGSDDYVSWTIIVFRD